MEVYKIVYDKLKIIIKSEYSSLKWGLQSQNEIDRSEAGSLLLVLVV